MGILRYTTQLCGVLQRNNWFSRTTILRLLVGLSLCLNMWEMAFVATHTTFLRLVIPTHGGMPESTWRNKNEPAWNFTSIPRIFRIIAWCLRGLLSLAVSLFRLRKVCKRRLTFTTDSRFELMTETTWVSFSRLSMCLPLKTIFPLKISLWTLISLTQLIIMKFQCNFPLLMIRLLVTVWSWTEFQDHIWKDFASCYSAWFHFKIEILEVVILQTHTDRIFESHCCFISFCCTKLLPSSWKSVAILRSLLFVTWSFFGKSTVYWWTSKRTQSSHRANGHRENYPVLSTTGATSTSLILGIVIWGWAVRIQT